ncbi:Cationic amino acid transporter 1 [Camellia lanceoleosa]|uniref:Cationic amino acid transporter 1 n=1 Tax=Camellia lanceoleosa TaxID=1840588 RepID=A0ACC0HJ98_9ERIC|nr:Cationic amino acid transporter 1 [Camellia lanceoleosa]
MWFGMGAVIGTGIFVLTGLDAKTVAEPAVVLSYMVSGGGLFETEEDEFEDEFLKSSADFFLQIMQMPSPSQGRLLECAIGEGEAGWVVDLGGTEVCDGGGAQEGVGGEGVVASI